MARLSKIIEIVSKRGFIGLDEFYSNSPGNEYFIIILQRFNNKSLSKKIVNLIVSKVNDLYPELESKFRTHYYKLDAHEMGNDLIKLVYTLGDEKPPKSI